MTKKALDELLTSLDIQLHAFAVCEVETNTRLAFDAMNVIVVHYVLDGSGEVEVAGTGRAPIGAGSIVIVPAGRHQTLMTGERAQRVVPASEHCLMLVDGLLRFDAANGAKGALRTICATITSTVDGSFGLFDRLPYA